VSVDDLNDPTNSKGPDRAQSETLVDPEQAQICPACSYSADDREFQVCPRCGLIIRKYYDKKRQTELGTVSGEAACGICGSALDSARAVCPKCGGPEASSKSTSSIGKFVVVATCTAMVVFSGVMYAKRTLTPELPAVGAKEPSPEANQSPRAADAGARVVATDASAAYSQDKSAQTSPPPSEALPNAISNSLSITKAKVVFSSGMDSNNMPVNDLNQLSIKGKKIVCHVKMVIPPEKTYKFTGRIYDGEGKLVLNFTSSSSPTVARWFAWFYHDFDRSVDKPGLWRFSFLVNGEPIAEQRVEVTD